MGSLAYTWDDKAVREDLLAVLTNLTPTDTQLTTGLGVNEAKQPLHQWLTDSLGSVKDNAQVEGADATFHNLTNPTRLFNFTQIFKQGFRVSDTERETLQAAFADRYAYEATKALKMLKNDMELAVLRGSLACGGDVSVARQLLGIEHWLSLVTNQSGISLTATILEDYFQMVWDNGTEVNACYGSMYIKRKISGFSAGATKYMDQADRRLTNAIDIYEADAAKIVKLFAHRHMTISGTDTHYDVLCINEDLFKTAYLRKPFIREIPKTGDATKGEAVCEVTVECLHKHAGVLGQKHT
jgi:hypothetical protein